MFNVFVFILSVSGIHGYKDDQGMFIPGSSTVDEQGVYDHSKGMVGGYIDENGNYVPNSALSKK